MTTVVLHYNSTVSLLLFLLLFLPLLFFTDTNAALQLRAIASYYMPPPPPPPPPRLSWCASGLPPRAHMCVKRCVCVASLPLPPTPATHCGPLCSRGHREAAAHPFPSLPFTSKQASEISAREAVLLLLLLLPRKLSSSSRSSSPLL